MSEQRVLFLEKSVIATCALAAVVLLASFYMVVSGAVQRGLDRHRMASVDPVTQTAATAQQRNVGRGGALLARVGN